MELDQIMDKVYTNNIFSVYYTSNKVGLIFPHTETPILPPQPSIKEKQNPDRQMII